MKKLLTLPKKHYFIGIAALLLWLITFFTDTRIFTSDPLAMNCLPVNLQAVTWMHVLTKILVLVVIFLTIEFLAAALHRKTLLLPFLLYLSVYVAGLLLNFPGYFMSDDSVIFAYATRFYPVYWHNYLTSLFYTTGMSLFPASSGPILLSDLLYAMTYSFLFYQGEKLYTTRFRYAFLIPGLLPFTLLGALMSFRPALYAPFFLFYFVYLFFEWKHKAVLTGWKIVFLGFFTALLCIWRSEGIILLVFSFFLLSCVYGRLSAKGARPVSMRNLLFYAVCLILMFTMIKAPQKSGEEKYYGSDYLIISTTRPLSVIVHRDQTYEGAEEDLANINAVTDFGYLHNDSLSCSAYNRYNTDHNQGKYTETGASSTVQKAYLKSALRLILHNPDLYLGERLQLFLVTNGIFTYDSSMVLDLKPVVSTDFHLYANDRAYGFELIRGYQRIALPENTWYASFLFTHGGEAYLPVLVLMAALLIVSLIRRKWFFVFCLLSLFARECVIFLTAPASFIQYSYPVMYVTAFALIAFLADWRQEKSRSLNQ